MRLVEKNTASRLYADASIQPGFSKLQSMGVDVVKDVIHLKELAKQATKSKLFQPLCFTSEILQTEEENRQKDMILTVSNA